MHLFYADVLSPENGFLGKEESHHATRVLRLSAGGSILVTQGIGVIYEAEITQLSKTALSFTNTRIFSEEKRGNYLHIAIAPTKSLDRFELFLEKATEIGVNEITPIISFHSERKVYKTERGLKVVKSAAKQSLSNWLPKLNEAISYDTLIKQTSTTSKFIAHCEDEKVRQDLLHEIHSIENCLILIGPEGDFSSAEIKKAIDNKFKPVTLGPKRLRTETAGIAVSIAAKLLS